MGPFKLTQQGAYLAFRADPEHPDYEAFRKVQRQVADGLPDRLLALREDLAKAMAPHHAFDVIFGVWMTYGRVRASTLQPLAGDALTSTAEFVAHVLLDRDGPEPTRSPSIEELRSGANPYELGEMVAEIVSFLPVLFTTRQLGHDGDLDPWLELRSRLYMHRLAVRSFTYEKQETETLMGLFKPFDVDLARAPGYTVEQALALARGAGELPMIGAGDRGAIARAEAEKLRQVVAARREGKTVKTDYPDEVIDRLVEGSSSEAEQWIVGLTASWAWHACGRDAAFTAQNLADHVGLPVQAAQAFLDEFSVDFGQREDRERWEADPKRALGGEMEVIRSRPILHAGDGSYLPCALDSLLYGLRDRLTDGLKKDPKAWERFQAHRARLIEDRALAALSAALRANWSHGSIKYTMLEEDGTEQDGEADGVIRSDSLIVLVETKAGTLAPCARRTAPDRLERGLRDLVETAARQLDRDKQALIERRTTKITDSNGKPIVLDTDGITRVLRVAVTLEDLSAVAPATWRLQEAGLLPADEQAPWVVGIHELELICRLVERPAQLVHYIVRRARANRHRIWAMDEMDFFMRYLQEGLHWDDEEVEGTYLELGNHTNPLDEWWFGEQGMRKPARKPRQRINNATRQLLDDIEATGMSGRIEAQLIVLEMDTSGRERVASGLRTMLRKTQRDGKPHDMTLVFGQDFAVSLHAAPAEPASLTSERLGNHGVMRTEKSNLRRWLGLATVAGNKSRLSAMAVIVNPERLDAEEPDRTATS
jgi:hypothetical protein